MSAERLPASGDDEGPAVAVLGAGPAGLAAAHALARAGSRPVVLERAPHPGGAMRGVRHDGFSVDLGRKVIYERIPEVVALWEELLGEDLRVYPHRIGVLHDGRIIERSSSFRGPLRGMPPGMLARGAASFVRAQLRAVGSGPPANYEEYWHRSRGEHLCRVLSQGYNEKFYGSRWRDRPVDAVVPSLGGDSEAGSFSGAVRSLWRRMSRSPELHHPWRHPRRGTGQLVDALVREIEAAGGRFLFGTEIRALSCSGDRVTTVQLRTASGDASLPVQSVISGLPFLALTGLLGLDASGAPPSDPNRHRQTLLLYLFVEEPARFPHAWLEVTCPRLRAGRITGYANFGGGMVPEGRSCVAVELFAKQGDDILEMDDTGVADLLTAEVTGAGLVTAGRVSERLLLRAPGAEASNQYRTWQSPAFRALVAEVGRFNNLFDVNRAGIDIAAFAGLSAARAILSADRSRFEREASPDRPYSETRSLD